MFAYPCPSCTQRLLAPPERAGQRTVCPKCLRPLTVPKAASAFAAVAVDTPPPAAWSAVPVEAAVEVVAPVALTVGGPDSGVEFETADVPQSYADAPVPRTARPSSRKPLDGSDSGRVILNPTGLFAVDIAAELSAAISMRMAPPPDPTSDRYLTLAGWLIASAVAAVLWFVGVFFAPEAIPFVALVGGAMVAFGWMWRAYLAGRAGSVANGLVTLLPPAALARLVVPTPTHGLRPLRFVLTGAVFLGLFVLAPAVRSVVETELSPRLDDSRPPVSGTVADRLKRADAGKKFDELLAELKAMPTPETVAVEQRPDALRELTSLAKHERADVRAVAFTALAGWSAADAKSAVRAALAGSDVAERRAACKVADKVLGADAAESLAACLTDREHRDDAKAALVRLGAAAEPAVLPLLASDREPIQLVACEVLEQVGGTTAAAALADLAGATKSRAVRVEATQAADAITRRKR